METKHEWLSMEELLESYKQKHKDLRSDIRAERRKTPMDVAKVEVMKNDLSNLSYSIKCISRYLHPAQPVKYKNKLTDTQSSKENVWANKHRKQKEKIYKKEAHTK